MAVAGTAFLDKAAGFDGILLDLGVSSLQLDSPERGFSFMKEGPLDMRLDGSQGMSAARWLESQDEAFSLKQVLRELGEEPRAGAMARVLLEGPGPKAPWKHHHGPGRRGRAGAGPPQAGRDPSGHAALPGPAPGGERGAGSAGQGPARSGGPAGAGRPHGGDQLPLPRRPQGQRIHRAPEHRLHLPAGFSGLPLRAQGQPAALDQEAPRSG